MAIKSASNALANNFENERRLASSPAIVNGAVIGGFETAWIAGPAQVRDREQMMAAGLVLKRLGVPFLRSSLCGLETHSSARYRALELLVASARSYNLRTVCPIEDLKELDLFSKWIDVIEVGPNQAQDWGLLNELGHIDRLVLLSRGTLQPIKDFENSLRMLERGKRAQIVIVEQGVLPGAVSQQLSLDLAFVDWVRNETPYPLIVNCYSKLRLGQSTDGAARAVVAAGADGIMLDFDPVSDYDDPDQYWNTLVCQLARTMSRVSALKSTLNALAHRQAFFMPTTAKSRTIQ